jgi:hypothetical protein
MNSAPACYRFLFANTLVLEEGSKVVDDVSTIYKLLEPSVDDLKETSATNNFFFL